ncbi:sugar phosphate nucleotidyltransferase [Fodinibius saliphilus]|uniref:sugar phosphate nucleotidyltransferase n=1 Tax=Fodinibius saliphilus TaxID=1920650 RepID=UPI0011085C71|nr:sugar phosphate nucleotidyltransferase [Fodinibius saliphilus]
MNKSKVKGIIWAVRSKPRLYPTKKSVANHLMPVYDKPLIYYPLSVLMLAGIQDILIITSPADSPDFKNMLGDGSVFGVNISYELQRSCDDIVDALVIAEGFIGDDKIVLIRGDDIFYDHNMRSMLRRAVSTIGGATLFGHRMKNFGRFGMSEDKYHDEVICIEEDSKNSLNNKKMAVTGPYFYDDRVIDYAKQVSACSRSDSKLSVINKIYLKQNKITAEFFSPEYTWLSVETLKEKRDASSFLKSIERKNRAKVFCPEEIAWRNNWIDDDQVMGLACDLKNNSYGEYLYSLLSKKNDQRISTNMQSDTLLFSNTESGYTISRGEI